MTSDDDQHDCEFSTVDDLQAFLARCEDVSRVQRRALVAGAKKLRGLLACDGVPSERVRFRVIRCTCCDQVELSGYDRGLPRSEFH